MNWITISAILGGSVVGFMAGASRTSAGGNVAAAVAALQLGVFGFIGQANPAQEINAEYIGKLFTLFLVFLLVFYVGGNVLRKHRRLEWMGISSR
jgi:flagellar biosynthesis protein FliR